MKGVCLMGRSAHSHLDDTLGGDAGVVSSNEQALRAQGGKTRERKERNVDNVRIKNKQRARFITPYVRYNTQIVTASDYGVRRDATACDIALLLLPLVLLLLLLLLLLQ